MKYKLIAIISVCIMCMVSLFGCGNNPLSIGPNTTDTVYGNGGMVVQKGEYLYYVNGYVSNLALTYSDNRNDSTINSAIYRTTLNADGSIDYDDDGNILNTYQVVSKVAGFENTGIYIFGNYLYYATPNNQRDKEGDLRTDLIDFYRIKLDGSDNEKIYTSGEFENIEFAFYSTSAGITLAVYEGANLVTINVGKKIGSPVTLATNVTSVAFPELTNYRANETIDDINTYLYYTRDILDSDNLSVSNGNVAVKAKLGTNSQTVLCIDGSNTYDFITVKNSRLYYTRKNNVEQIAKIYESKMLTNNLVNVDNNNVTQRTNLEYTTVVPMPYASGSYSGLLVTDADGNLKYVKDENETTNGRGTDITLLGTDTDIKVLAISGGYIVYTDADELFYMSVDNADVVISLLGTNDSAKLSINVAGDICGSTGQYFYFYKEVVGTYGDTTYYLFRTDLFDIDTEGAKPCYLVGVYEDGDEPIEEDEEE
ncbi:MAG: hypothetical protein WCX32_03270 [Clostridia bacterium]